jgi:hypothetical protein
MPDDIEVQDASTVVTEDEEATEHTEGDGCNREEVHRGNRFPIEHGPESYQNHVRI